MNKVSLEALRIKAIKQYLAGQKIRDLSQPESPLQLS